MNDIERVQVLQPRADVLGLDDESEQSPVESPADRRRRLQQRAILPRQPIRPCRQQALQARRQANVAGVWVEFHVACGDAQCAALDQETQDLFAEQRIALGPLGDLTDERIGGRGDAESGLQQMPDVARGHRLQPQSRHARTIAPVGNIFGSPGSDDEQVGLREVLDHSAENLLGDAVAPVNVLERQDDRGCAASSL
jgi:hypothetical protein